MRDIYNDNTYLSNNPGWHEEDALFKVERIERLLKKCPVPYKTVCDIGCGSGEIISVLQKRNPDFVKWFGYDISAEAIKIASPKSNDSLQFVLADFTELHSQDTFDLILVIDVIEHLDNYFSFLHKIRNRSKFFIFHIVGFPGLWPFKIRGKIKTLNFKQLKTYEKDTFY